MHLITSVKKFTKRNQTFLQSVYSGYVSPAQNIAWNGFALTCIWIFQVSIHNTLALHLGTCSLLHLVNVFLVQPMPAIPFLSVRFLPDKLFCGT